MYICAWLKNNNSVIPPRVIFREGGVRFGQVNLTTKNTLVCFFFLVLTILLLVRCKFTVTKT